MGQLKWTCPSSDLLFGGPSGHGFEENLAKFTGASGFTLAHGADRFQQVGGRCVFHNVTGYASAGGAQKEGRVFVHSEQNNLDLRVGFLKAGEPIIGVIV